jgi:PPM family protein phosphatase
VSTSNEARFEFASRTHPGCVRELNEDQCAVFETAECIAVLVADGVSGERGGDTASRMAVEVTREELLRQATSLSLEKRLYRAVQRANIAIYDLGAVVPELRGMSTTLTAILVTERALIAAHVGDCRAYLWRAGELKQLTRDHTVTARRVRFGLLSKAKARQHPGRSVLTRSLGRELIAQVDQFRARLSPRDLIVACSDGIHGVLDDAQFAEACSSESATQVCETLIQAAQALGSPDNMTAAAVRIGASMGG